MGKRKNTNKQRQQNDDEKKRETKGEMKWRFGRAALAAATFENQRENACKKEPQITFIHDEDRG